MSLWLEEHWFSLIESVGIVGSLLFTTVTLRHDLRARRNHEHLLLSTQHRKLWGELHRRPRLARILERERDLTAEPLTVEEEQFLMLAIVHYQNGWLLSGEGSLISRQALALDAGDFFSRPAPHQAWVRVRGIQDSRFVQFVETSLRAVELPTRTSAGDQAVRQAGPSPTAAGSGSDETV